MIYVSLFIYLLLGALILYKSSSGDFMRFFRVSPVKTVVAYTICLVLWIIPAALGVSDNLLKRFRKGK